MSRSMQRRGFQAMATRQAPAPKAATPPSHALSSLAVNQVPANGGRGNVEVKAAFHTKWTAESNQPFLHVSPVHGAGRGRVHFVLDPNPTPEERQAVLTVDTHTVVMVQAGTPAPIVVDAVPREDGTP